MIQSERDKISQLRGQIEATIELLYSIRGSLVNARDDLYELLQREELNTYTTVETEPIRHAHWIDVKNSDGSYGSLWRCSICGETQCWDSNYCGSCGAEMGLNNTYTTGHNERDTEVWTTCDKCDRLESCKVEDRLFDITVSGNMFRHYLPSLDGCPIEGEVTE